MNVPQHSPTPYQNCVHYDGDVNYDFEVNIADLNSVIDIILNASDSTDVNPLADVNFDGDINIADVNELIDIILGDDEIHSNVHVYGDDHPNEGLIQSVTDSTVVVNCRSDKVPKPGEIIVCGVTENAPYGFLRHVDSVKGGGNNYEIVTTNASLEEVLPNGNYSVHLPVFEEGDTISVQSPGKAPLRVSLKKEIKFLLKFKWADDQIKFCEIDTDVTEEDIKNVLEGEAEVNYPISIIVKLTPSANLDFIFQKHNDQLDRLGVTGGVNFDVELLGKLAIEIHNDALLGKDGIKLFDTFTYDDPITLFWGPIPIVISKGIEVRLCADANGQLYFQSKFLTANAKADFSYIYSPIPDPITNKKHNLFTDHSCHFLGDEDLVDRVKSDFAPKFGMSGSVTLKLVTNPGLYLYGGLFSASLPVTPWLRAEGSFVLPLKGDTEVITTEIVEGDDITISSGLDMGVSAKYNIFGLKDTFELAATVYKKQFEVLGLLPSFEKFKVFPNEPLIPTSTEQLRFSAFMAKPLIQLLKDNDYGFAYGIAKDSTHESWRFIGLKDEYDDYFTISQRKQYIETIINTSDIQKHTIYKVCPFVSIDATNKKILMKGKEFRITEPFDDFTVSENYIKTYPRKIEAIEIIGGSGQYSVSSNNESVAVATISDHHVNVETTGIGTATITVTDDNNPECSLPIVVTVVPYPKIQTYHINGVSFKMVEVEGGSFTMGATAEQGSEAESQEFPTHRVTLSDFSIGETEVTQELWKAVMGSNPSRFSGNLKRPVEKVTLEDCQTFINKLNELTGKVFRLPTEAEWEYAARGGNMSRHYKYAGSNSVDDVAWYIDNASNVGSSSPDYGTHTVAIKAPNELGLFDMSGNVWELCQDRYGSYSNDDQFNPKGPESGSNRVIRGGGWVAFAKSCRVARRQGSNPSSRYEYRGLRLALSEDGFVLSQNTAKIVMDSTKTFKIYGGSGTFTASGYDYDIVSVTISGRNLIVTANNLGNTTITVKDKDTDEEEKIDITVEPDIKIFYIYEMPIKMVRVKGGTFTMGGTAEQGSDAASNERPTHQVTLRDFYISQTEITQEQWKKIMGYNYSHFSPTYGYLENLQRPVESVSWQECLTFINTLRRITRKTYDLPTEAQWEYAARGGIKSKGYKYSGSNTIDDVAWYYNNIPSLTPGSNGYGTQTVATKKPNELGIYDMSGNVNEWCQDWYGSYTSESQYEPTGPSTAALKVLRGGNWLSPKINCRIPFRGFFDPSDKNSLTGLRIVLENE